MITPNLMDLKRLSKAGISTESMNAIDLRTFTLPLTACMYVFVTKLNIVKLLLDLLLLSNELPDIEAVWDVVEHVRPNGPDHL